MNTNSINKEKKFWFCTICAISILLSSCDKVNDPDGNTISNITITSIKPTHGPFGTTDTIIGKGFDKIPEIDSVLLNGKKLTLISKSDEQVIVQIPVMAGTGNIDVWYNGKLIHGPLFTYDSTLMVTTLAGSSTASGAVNGDAVNARFSQPQGIAVDPAGNVYVADRDNSAVRKITPQGNVTTLAGVLGETGGYVDGTGTAAEFSQPQGLAMGPDGFLYLVDHINERVRKISLSGVVTTYAGHYWNTGIPGWDIDGDTSVASFNRPFGLAIDAFNDIYIADAYNNKIKKISVTGMVSTYAGAGYFNEGYRDGPRANSLFSDPRAVAIDGSGNLYVMDDGNNRLRKIAADGTVSTVLGNLEPYITGNAVLFSTTAFAFDKAGNLFFAVSTGIVKMKPNGEIIRYAMGGSGNVDGPAQIATYRAIAGLAVDDSGTIYITDNNRVRKIYWQ